MWVCLLISAPVGNSTTEVDHDDDDDDWAHKGKRLREGWMFGNGYNTHIIFLLPA